MDNLRLNNAQHRRLAVRAKKLGHEVLAEVASIVTPDTLLSWHRKLIALVRLPARSPNLNAYAERFVRRIKSPAWIA